MGVINLSILVEKLRKKLSGDFVTKTDYATKTKFGIVKIGDGISVSNGKISVDSAGMTMDELFSGNVVQGGSADYTLLHPYTDYKFLSLVSASGVNTTAGGFMAVANLSTGTYNSNGTGNSAVASIRLDSSDATKFSTPSGSGTVAIKIYGIK